MKIYKVERTDEWDYDEYDAVIVRAATAEDAVSLVVGDEVHTSITGRNMWVSKKFEGMDAHNVIVTEIPTEGPEEVLLASFHAG